MQQPIWPSELTAWGTLAVAVAAVAIALFAEWRASVRVSNERKYSAKVLADERRAADDRLQRQLDHSDAQFRAEREAERDQGREADAWSVEVLLAQYDKASPADEGEPDDKELEATVTNYGSRTISRVRAQFSPNGIQRVRHSETQQLSRRASENPFDVDPDDTPMPGILPPNSTMRLASDRIASKFITAPKVIVRWQDYSGQQWEYDLGEVHRAKGADW